LAFNFYGIQEGKMEKCEWKFVDDDGNHYESECGGEWFYFEGTTKENHMNFCPFCGEPVHEVESTIND